MLSTVVNINIHHARNISNIILMKRKHVRIHITMVNKHFNAFFMSTNYCFVMYSSCNIVVLVKSFETTVYVPKTEVG